MQSRKRLETIFLGLTGNTPTWGKLRANRLEKLINLIRVGLCLPDLPPGKEGIHLEALRQLEGRFKSTTKGMETRLKPELLAQNLKGLIKIYR